MKNKCLLSLTLIFFLSTFSLLYSFAQDTSQFSLPEGVKARYGKGIKNGIKYSPDGTRLAVVSSIGIWLYDTETYQEIALLTGHTEAITCIDFSPDGKTIASGSTDQTVRLWDVTEAKHKQTLTGQLHGVYSIAYSPDGSVLASGSTGERDGLEIFGAQIIMWDTTTGEQIHTLTAEGEVNALVFSSNGRILASAEDWPHYAIRLWDTATGKQTYTLTDGPEVHKPFVENVKSLAIGNMLISKNSNDTISVYDIDKLKLVGMFTELTEETICATLSSDQQTLSTGNIKKNIELWDMTTGKLKQSIAVSRTPQHIAFSPDDKTLTISMFGDTIYVLDVATGDSKQILRGFNPPIKSIAFDSDKNILAIPNNVNIELWDIATNVRKHTLTGHIRHINTIVFSPDRNTIASGSADSTIRFWDVNTSKPIRTLEGIYGHTGPVTGIAFSSDGKTLASGSADATICLWDVNTGKRKANMSTRIGDGNCVVFSNDGKTLVSGGEVKHRGEDHSFGFKGILLWNVRTGRYKYELKGKMADIYCVAFSPDGHTLASGEGWADYAIRLWDIDRNKLKHALKGHTGDVNSIAFSPDGSILASGSADNTIRLWDVATRKHLHTLTGHTGDVNSVVFSADGNLLMSGSNDGTVLIWDLTSTITKHQPIQ